MNSRHAERALEQRFLPPSRPDPPGSDASEPLLPCTRNPGSGVLLRGVPEIAEMEVDRALGDGCDAVETGGPAFNETTAIYVTPVDESECVGEVRADFDGSTFASASKVKLV
jgi:hypothetical protein